jgi:penicillin-binding protein 1C
MFIAWPAAPAASGKLLVTQDGDGKTFARGNSAAWLPWPGRHLIELIDARGQVADWVRLEVRDAGIRAPARQ